MTTLRIVARLASDAGNFTFGSFSFFCNIQNVTRTNHRYNSLGRKRRMKKTVLKIRTHTCKAEACKGETISRSVNLHPVACWCKNWLKQEPTKYKCRGSSLQMAPGRSEVADWKVSQNRPARLTSLPPWISNCFSLSCYDICTLKCRLCVKGPTWLVLLGWRWWTMLTSLFQKSDLK